MRYQFKSLYNDLYVVGIKGSVKELTPSNNPLNITHKQEYIYAPVMTSTATLSIYGGDYLRELYSDNVLDHYVKITKNGATFWEGYITQNVYSQDFSCNESEFEIECIDVLSAFKLLAYNGDNFPTFLELILSAFKSVPDVELSNIYIQKTVSFEGSEPLNLLSCAAANWYDEDNQPSSLRDLFDEIGKFLCMTFVYDAGSLYLIDRTSDNRNFWRYSKASGYKISDVVIDLNQTGVKYRGSGQRYSINESKNKITLTNSLYEVEEVFSPPIENKFVGSREDQKEGDANTVRYRRFYETDPTVTKVLHYSRVGDAYLPVTDVYDPNKVYGAQLIKYQEINKSQQYANNWERMIHIRNKYQEENNAFVLPRNLPIFETTVKRKPIAWSNVNLCISARVKLNSSIAGFGNDIKRPRGNFTPIRIPVQISIGSKYWSGAGWVDTPTTIALKFKCDGGKSENMCENWFPVENNNLPEWNTPDLDGYTIQVSGIIHGDLNIKMFRPYLWNGGGDLDEWSGSDNGLARIFTVKDLKVNFATPDPNAQFKDEFATPQDRIFEELISEAFDEREHSIECLLSTHLNGSLAKSYVLQGSGYLDKITRGTKDIAERHSVTLHTAHFRRPRVVLGLEIDDFGLLKRMSERHTGNTYAVLERDYNVRDEVAQYQLIEL